MKKLINSFKYAICGIKSSFKSERNMKLHFFSMCCVIILGILLKISLLEWIICLILFSLVISAEMFNTSIETIVDMITKENNKLAKLAKDIAAGAVLFNAIIAFIIGLLIFLPKFFSY